MDAGETALRVAHARVGRLATVDREGRPHLVPFCFAAEGETIYSAVDAKPKHSQRLRRLENIREHPSVSILVDHYDEDWSRLWWVRLDGRAEVLEGGSERERALRLLEEKYEQYRARRPDGPVIAVRVEGRRAWTANEKEGGER
ncbi:MAG: TIGR03668 family PPOX class F420-dependent oxidoreductase [Actinomycetota bacterium]|nr:TIGR03668 family PPOX class F420-dependent oxidoreductase [Actinomycetota bacterium]